MREAVGDFDLRLDIGAFHELKGVAPFYTQAEGVRIEVDVHVAGLDVVLQVAVAGHEVYVGTFVKGARAVDGKAVEFAVAISVIDVEVRVGVAEGSAHDPVAHACIAANLDGRARHVDAVGFAPPVFAAVDTGPGTNVARLLTYVAQALREVVDLVAPLYERRCVDALEGFELGISLFLFLSDSSIGINRLKNCTANVAFFDHARLRCLPFFGGETRAKRGQRRIRILYII